MLLNPEHNIQNEIIASFNQIKGFFAHVPSWREEQRRAGQESMCRPEFFERAKVSHGRQHSHFACMTIRLCK